MAHLSLKNLPWMRRLLIAITLAGSMAQATETPQQPATQAAAPAPAKPSKGAPTHYTPDRFAGRAGTYYLEIWGIDSISVKLVESGELVRFSYRVVDPDRAKALNDKKSEPSLIELAVPLFVASRASGTQRVAGTGQSLAS